MNEQDEQDYKKGYQARSKGLLKNACPFKEHEGNIGRTRWRRRTVWLGGWNDKDIEFKASGKNYE
tara:strand:+ start:252 stop:446 length:195 start_codon:yes stop_codon:yes gene_type:complete